MSLVSAALSILLSFSPSGSSYLDATWECLGKAAALDSPEQQTIASLRVQKRGDTYVTNLYTQAADHSGFRYDAFGAFSVDDLTFDFKGQLIDSAGVVTVLTSNGPPQDNRWEIIGKLEASAQDDIHFVTHSIAIDPNGHNFSWKVELYRERVDVYAGNPQMTIYDGHCVKTSLTEAP